MARNIQIQQIDPARVVYKLISQTFGTYIIRVPTENDDILLKTSVNRNSNSQRYVILSVRVDEEQYPSPIMNYYLPLDEPDASTYSFEKIKDYFHNEQFPELIHEHPIEIDDTDWSIDQLIFEDKYVPIYSSTDNVDDCSQLYGYTTCNFSNGTRDIQVFNKIFEKNDKGFQHELSILKSVSYFHLIPFYGIHIGNDSVKCIMFAYHGQSLKNICPLQDTNEYLSRKMLFIGYQITCAMIYLEKKQISHGNLCAKAILIDQNLTIKISDFRYSIRKENDNDKKYFKTLDISKFKSQVRYFAPECLPLLSQSHQDTNLKESLVENLSSKSDIWSFGLVLIELILEKDDLIYPYLPVNSNLTDELYQIVTHIKYDRKIHELMHRCPIDIYNTIKQCWNYLPNDRISFTDIRNEILTLFYM